MPMLAGLHNCSQRCLYLSVVQMTLLNAPQPRTALLLPFVTVFRPPIEVAFAAWQVRVCVWPSPTVNDLHVLNLAKAAIAIMAIISQPHCSCSPIVPYTFPVPLSLFSFPPPEITV